MKRTLEYQNGKCYLTVEQCKGHIEPISIMCNHCSKLLESICDDYVLETNVTPYNPNPKWQKKK